jgi:hypothetical protein
MNDRTLASPACARLIFYRGDLPARLAEREQKLARAHQARKAYWHGHDRGLG